MVGPVSANMDILLSRGVAPALVCCGALLLDSGAHIGVVKKMGDALQHRSQGVLRAIGCCPKGKNNAWFASHPLHALTTPQACVYVYVLGLSGAVNLSGKKSTITSVDPHHDAVCLVEGRTWGVELGALATLLGALAPIVPGVAIVANGGEVAKLEVWSQYEQTEECCAK